MPDTMNIYGQTCNVLYVDVTLATGANDGSTPANALKLLPATASLAANTVYLCRRTILNQPANGLTTPNSGNSLTLSSGNNTNDYVYVIGHPKSTDPLYQVAPAAAKAAWDADIGDYAGLQTPNGASINGVNNANFAGLHWGFSRIAFFFPNTGAGNTFSNSACISGTGSGSSVFITNFQWTVAGVNVSTTTTTNNVNRMVVYLGFFAGNPDKLDINNGYIQQYPGVTQSNKHQSFISSNIQINNLNLSNLTCYYTSSANASSDTNVNAKLSWLATFTALIYNVNVTNISLFAQIQDTTLHAAGYGPSFGGILFNSVQKDFYADGIKFKIDRYFNPSAVYTQKIFFSYIFRVYTTTNSTGARLFNATNIDVDLGDLGAASSTESIVLLLPSRGSQSGTVAGKIKNIRVNTNYNTPKTTITSNSSIGLELSGLSGITQISNITSNNPRGYGLKISNSNYFSTPPIFNNINIQGILEVLGIPYIYINSLDTSIFLNTSVIQNTAYQTTGQNPSLIYINSLTLNSGAWSSPAISQTYGARLLVNQTTTYPAIGTSAGVINDTSIAWTGTPTNGGGSATNGYVMINNMNGISGNWYAQNYWHKIATNPVYRTGGASSSLRFSAQISYTSINPLVMAPYPFKGIQWTPTTGQSGSNYLVYYVAYKAYAQPAQILSRINIQLQIPYVDVNNVASGGSTMYQIINSRSHGNLVPDSSTWNGDSGLTIMKYVIPFNTTLDNQPVNIRIQHGLYDIIGYLYMCPKFQIYNSSNVQIY